MSKLSAHRHSISKHYSLAQALALFGINITDSMLAGKSGHLVNDTRELDSGDVFCAVIGSTQNACQYITDAVEQGAIAIIAQCQTIGEHGGLSVLRNSFGQAVPVISFYQLNENLFELAKAYYQSPQNSMTVIGITGTNGKTSTSQILAKLLISCQKNCAVIGTNGAGQLHALKPLNNTTPAATELHQLLADFRDQQCQHVAMEISSHALEQGRVNAQLLDIAVFTNLTRDHLDYHQTMANYADAKYQIFSHDERQVAVINGDDSQAQCWLDYWPDKQPLIVYGRQEQISDYELYAQAKQIKHLPSGFQFTLMTHKGQQVINSQLIGDFNIDNLLAAIAVLLIKNISLEDIAQAVTLLTPVIGRMEVYSAENKATAVVDYAHTPDALINALKACREHCQGELWVVFGCGGDRDKGKRPLMAHAAELNADHLVFTNDNPRNEQPKQIIREMLIGCTSPEKVTITLDRQQAVLTTLAQANANDVVLLAGKGHEDYTIIGNDRINYNERALVKSLYANNSTSTHEAVS